MFNFKILIYLLKQWRIVQNQMRKGLRTMPYSMSVYNVGVLKLFISAIINVTNLPV